MLSVAAEQRKVLYHCWAPVNFQRKVKKLLSVHEKVNTTHVRMSVNNVTLKFPNQEAKSA